MAPTALTTQLVDDLRSAPADHAPAWTGLAVVGAGMGRTGTTSLKAALQILGLPRCYHMSELQEQPAHIGPWIDASLGRPIDWDQLLHGYDATLDWPACSFWHELSDRYPTAKVILTTRDPDAWFDSVMATGYHILKRLHTDAVARGDEAGQLGNLLIMNGRMLDIFPDRERAIAAFEEHNAEVRATVAPHRLLEFETGAGWEPLCDFLGLPVPDVPYPTANSKADFWKRAT